MVGVGGLRNLVGANKLPYANRYDRQGIREMATVRNYSGAS